MTAQPVACRWTGQAFIPAPRFMNMAAQTFRVDDVYPLAVHEDRSPATHRHYFALVNEAWVNLPEDMADRWPTAEHLRKWALIKAGYRDERTIVCSSKAEATRIKAFIRPMDEYAVILSQGATVLAYTAKSQSVKAMGKKTFQASKEAVLGVLSEIIGAQLIEPARQTEDA